MCTFCKCSPSPSCFHYFLLAFQICTFQWLNYTNMKDEINWSYTGGGVVLYVWSGYLTFSIIRKYDSSVTVWLNRIAHPSVGILILHHYTRDLAHLSDFYRLVIGMYKFERWAKKNRKWRTISELMKFAHFWIVSVRKSMVKKYWISDRFDFFDRFFSAFFFIIPYYHEWEVGCN